MSDFDLFRQRGTRSRFDPRVDPFSLPQEELKPEHLLMIDAYGATTLGSTGFGPSLSRFITSGVFNSDFFSLPATPGSDIDASANVMPYWPLTKASGTAVTGRNVADSGTGSGRVLRFSIAAGAAGDDSYVEQIIPVNGSRGRFYIYEFTAAFRATGTGLPEAYISLQYLKADLTTTGSSITNTRTLTVINGGTGNIAQFGVGATLGHVPADAQFARVRLGLKRAAAANGTTGSVDVLEIFADRWSTNGSFFPDAVDNTQTAGGAQQQNGTLRFGFTDTHLSVEADGDMTLFSEGGTLDAYIELKGATGDINLSSEGDVNVDPDGEFQVNSRAAWVPSRIDGWMTDNLAAAQAETVMGRFIPTETRTHIARPLTGRAGRAVAIGFRKTAAITAGSMTMYVSIGGAAGTAVAILNSASNNADVFAFTAIPFDGISSIAITISSDASYAPTTIDYAAYLIVEHEVDP